MPTRIIRDGILDSKAVNSLSEQAELFYRRLMSIVDDYGRFEADADLIRARCFPRQFDRWSTERIEDCLAEVSGDSPLVTVYECEGRKLLQINNFGQRVQSKPKYPGPDSPESTVSHGEKPLIRSRSRITKSESDTESLTPEISARTAAVEIRKRGEPKPGSPEKGFRISVEELPDEWAEYALTQYQWSRERSLKVFANFRDYWLSVPGAKGRKSCWFATWRNRCGQVDEATSRANGFTPRIFPDKNQTRRDETLKLTSMLMGVKCQ